MAWLSRMVTCIATSSVMRTLNIASTEKLISHYDRLTLAYRETDDHRCQGMIVITHIAVAEELKRRGIDTPMAESAREAANLTSER